MSRQTLEGEFGSLGLYDKKAKHN